MGKSISPTLSEELANLGKDDDDSRKAAMKSLKLYLKNLDSDAIPLFLAKVSEANDAGPYLYGTYSVPLLEVLARVQGPKIVSHLENIMSTIVDMLKKTHLQEECSKAIVAIVRYGIEPTTQEDKKRQIVHSLCKPLSDCLLSYEKGVSCGAALSLKKLVDCDNWRFASHEMVNEVCLKLAGALESVSDDTDPYTGLVMSLAKKNSFVVEAYARLLVDAGLRILRCGLCERSSQKCCNSVRMVHSLMKHLNSKSIFSELELIIKELEECVSDDFVDTNGVAFEALQTAKKLLANNGLNISNSDVISVSGTSEWSNLSSYGSRLTSPLSGSPKSQTRDSSDHDEKFRSWESYDFGFPGFVPESQHEDDDDDGLRSRTPSQRTDSQLTVDSIGMYTTPRKLLGSLQDDDTDSDYEHGHLNKDKHEEGSIGNICNGCESVSSTEDETITDDFSHQSYDKFRRGEKQSRQVVKNSKWKMIAKMFLFVCLAVFITSVVLLSANQDKDYNRHTLVPT